LLFLGKTKLRIKKEDDALLILNNLIEKSTKPEIKSEAAQEISLYYISVKNYSQGIFFIEKSIELTENKDSRAEKQFLLARLFEINDLQKAEDEFFLVSKNTTDFDLHFYSSLNYAKSLDLSGKYDKSYEILSKLSHKYRDYPDLKQLADIEIANNLHYQKKFRESLDKYFEVIINFPNTATSAEAYYRLKRQTNNPQPMIFMIIQTTG